jgi:tellurite resistance-related uncharacterized protein
MTNDDSEQSLPGAPPRRAIAGFHLDEDGVWVAELDCGHAQHVRHEPPFQDRGWVLDEAQRSARIGQLLDCRNCLMPRLPDDVERYKATPEFDETTIPAGLLASHRLKADTWGRIVVVEGRLLYTIEEPEEIAFVLTPMLAGSVAPEARHHIEPRGKVRFFVEFLRRK